MSGKKEEVCVCVTGASGFIASHLVNLLLLRGYTVHATVRDLNDGAKTKHLKELEGAKERLRLFKADLLEEGSFDAAIAGCQGVFHTASPVPFNVIDPQHDVIDPALKGTLNVLAACKRSPTVKRVVLTSSSSVNLFTGVPRTPDAVIDETWFSKLEYCNQVPDGPWRWYVTSKILAEEAAWNFCKENGIDMVVMNPGMVIGPILQPTLNTTVALILNLINGTETYPNQVWPWVHVKDVAEAHIRAFEIPSAHGRYCLGESVHHFSHLVKLLGNLYPTLQIADKCDGDDILSRMYQFSQTKAKSLGIDYIPLEVSLKDTVEDFKDKKFPLVYRT